MSSEPMTDRRLAILRRRFETMSNVYVGADGCELLEEIDRLRAENERWVEHYANLLITCTELEAEVQRLRAGIKEYIEAPR